MRRSFVIVLASVALTALALVACAPPTPPAPSEPFSYRIDAAVVPHQATLEGPAGIGDVVALQDEDGLQYDFLADHVLVVPTDQTQLDAFLTRHQGEVVADDTEDGAERTVTVRIDASGFPLDRLVADADVVGVPGEHRFSNELAARLMALVLRERSNGLAIASDGLFRPNQTVLLTAAERSTYDPLADPVYDNPVARTGVVQAWQFLAGRTGAGSLRRVLVAIIDGGFAVDADGSATADANGASDWPARPLQWDFLRGRAIVGGTNPASCTGGSDCPWHGHGSASVATGRLDNGAFAAGTGGQVADPILLHVNLSFGQVKAAVDRARSLGAEVINLSFGGECGWWCRRDKDVIGFYNAFERAHDAGIVMVASAGNNGQDAAEHRIEPCGIADVVCVGALGSTNASGDHVYDDRARDFSNYGSAVHLWAPTVVQAWYGTEATPDIDFFGGTSASAPYVSGVIAMMKSVAPGLTPYQVHDLLFDTAWTDSPDPKVVRHLNAFEAVRRAADFRLPADRFEANDTPGSAIALMPGSHAGLTIDRVNDADYYRLALAGPTLATLALEYPGGLGRMTLPPYGREASQSCGSIEQLAYAQGANGLTAIYRIPAGRFVFSANAPGAPLPYHLTIGTAAVSIATDVYEPNDSFATANYLLDGGYVNATLDGVGDVDYYLFYSQGSFSTFVLTMSSRASVESADVPLTLQLYDGAGVYLGGDVSSADCAVQARVDLGKGFYTVRVSGPSAGAYRLWLGATGTQHPLIDVEAWFYLLLHPNVPVEFVVRDPEAWFVLDHVSDLDLGALVLDGAGLHLRLYDEAGQTLLGEGIGLEGGGEVIDLPAGSGGGGFLLQVLRTEPIVEGAELPLIPARLTSSN